MAAKRTATKSKASASPFALNMEISHELAAALDAWTAKLNSGPEGTPRWSRSDVIRSALWRAVRERGEKGEAP